MEIVILRFVTSCFVIMVISIILNIKLMITKQGNKPEQTIETNGPEIVETT